MEPRRNSDQKPEQAPGAGRSYDCTFCKHGFTTAQALGGHMNIHRKDKLAKAKEPKTNGDVVDYTRSFPQTRHPAHQIRRSYQVFLPSSKPSSKLDQSCGRVDANSTSLRIRSAEEQDEEDDDNHGNIDKLDLELRLGHDHW